MNQLYVLIGNGSSIGIVSSINSYRKSVGQPPLEVNLSNLFYYGDSFPFPMTDTPFLTEEHCPNLWTLGARPQMDGGAANVIISQIMTCSNVYAATPDGRISPVYYKAYGEFSSYLRYLMIFYNDQITDNDLSNIQVPLIDYLLVNYSTFDRIIFNSYNYDILLERLLMMYGFPMRIGCFQPTDTKVVVYKPHGSISFSYKCKYPPGTVYEIPYNELSYQKKLTLKDFYITYQFENDYPVHNGMIPPYGEAESYDICYYMKIRNALVRAARCSSPGDVYNIIGSSYGSFDRSELDQINTAFNPCVSATYVNPGPNKDFEAVLRSLFPSYRQTASL